MAMLFIVLMDQVFFVHLHFSFFDDEKGEYKVMSVSTPNFSSSPHLHKEGVCRISTGLDFFSINSDGFTFFICYSLE